MRKASSAQPLRSCNLAPDVGNVYKGDKGGDAIHQYGMYTADGKDSCNNIILDLWWNLITQGWWMHDWAKRFESMRTVPTSFLYYAWFECFAIWSGMSWTKKGYIDAQSTSLLMLEVAMPRLQRHVAPGNERCPQMCILVAWQILL